MKAVVGGLLVGVGLIGMAILLLLVMVLGAVGATVVGGNAGAVNCAPTPVSANASPTPTPSSSPCLPDGPLAAQVVTLAKQMAAALYVDPTCLGIISYPYCYYTWYKQPSGLYRFYPPRAPAFPQAVLDYQNQICPGCAAALPMSSAFSEGLYQCVSFVRDAYGPLYPMKWTANAFDLWATYQEKPGWREIPAAAASSPSQRGMPLPGDVMVFKDASVGHVAIVISVVPPHGTTAGSVTFANANSVSPSTTMPLLPSLVVDTSSWPGYTVWGYLRPALAHPAPTSTRVQEPAPQPLCFSLLQGKEAREERARQGLPAFVKKESERRMARGARL